MKKTITSILKKMEHHPNGSLSGGFGSIVGGVALKKSFDKNGNNCFNCGCPPTTNSLPNICTNTTAC